MTTTSADMLKLVATALLSGPTDAGARVYTPGDWPTWDANYPVLKLQVRSEEKTALGRGEISFTVVTVVRVIGQVTAPASYYDGSASVAEDALWRLQRQAEIAVINSYPLTAIIQQFPTINSRLAFSSEGEKHLAGIEIDIALEYYQGPEDFAPIAVVPLRELAITPSHYPPTRLDFTFA